MGERSVRRFQPGDEWEMAGIRIRIFEGKKRCKRCAFAGIEAPCGHDYVMKWHVPNAGWIPIPDCVPGLISDFIFENEAVLYERSLGFKGGFKFQQYLQHAMKHGWRSADAGLRIEQATKDTDLWSAS